jgi:tyrosine-protein phosphatase SIW14
MKRSRATLAFLLLLPFPLFAQTPSPTSAPAAAPAFPPLAHGEKLRITGIPNAGKISEVLYRGAQPREVGLSELKILGINIIVDLRGEDREKVDWERRRAEALGMRFVQIPVSGWSPPSDEQLVQFLSLLRDNPGHKIFVHCRFGDDRTGVFTAVYRMAIEKWSAEQAIKEMYFFGFNGFWHPSMKTFVHDFPTRLNSAPTFAPLRIPTSSPPPAKPAAPPQPGTLTP